MEGRGGPGRILLERLRRRLADYAAWRERDQYRARTGANGARSRVHFEDLHYSCGDGSYEHRLGELGRGRFRRDPDTAADSNANTDTDADTDADADAYL